MIVDLIANLVSPVDAIVAILLAVLDAVGAIGLCDCSRSVRACLGPIRAISRQVGAILDPPGGRTIPGSRKLTG